MDKSLQTTAEIRQQLSDRRHSDSTELIREDRSSSNEFLAEAELGLEALLRT